MCTAGHAHVLMRAYSAMPNPQVELLADAIQQVEQQSPPESSVGLGFPVGQVSKTRV